MTKEDQLCLLLARGELIPEGRPRILDLLATPLHWPRILECAYSHQIYPLLYRNLLALGFPNVPEAIQSELKGLYLANALRNQLLAEELARLLGLLEAQRASFSAAVESQTRSLSIRESAVALKAREEAERRIGKVQEADADLRRHNELEPPRR